MQSPLLSMLLGNNPAVSNLMALAQNAGLVDVAMQGYNAYQSGKLPDFVAYQYENNIKFRKFYDKHKDQTFAEFLAENGITLK